MKNTLLLLIFSITLSSCKKEKLIPNSNDGIDELSTDNYTNKSNQNATLDFEGTTIIGRKLNNPYKLSTMRHAYNQLSQGNNGNNLNANELYIRIKSNSAEQAKNIDDLGLELWEYPLDHEITQIGNRGYEVSNSAQVNNGVFEWLYTTVDVDFNFGTLQGAQYEILEHLFLPRKANDGHNSNTLFENVPIEHLEDKAIEMTGNKKPGGGNQDKAIKYNPEGYIRFQEVIGTTSTNKPVKNVKVRSRWWFDYGTAYTDDNGHFYISQQYRQNRNVNIIVIFENVYAHIRAIKSWAIFDGFLTERANIGEFQENSLENISYTFNNNSNLYSEAKKFWMCCHALNSIRESHIYSAQNGILTPPNNMNVWLTTAETESNSLIIDASAPMLKQMGNNSLLLYVAKAMLISSGNPLYAVAIQALQQFLPDITYSYAGSSPSENLQSDKISNVFYHEYAHASHYRKVGNQFWTAYIAYIVANDGYGDPSEAGAQRIALSEAWAEHCGNRFTHSKYGSNNSFVPNFPFTWLNNLESFKPYANPDNWTYWNWQPDGVFQDLEDVGEPVWSNVPNVIDNISGISMAQSFSFLDASTISVIGFRNKVLTYAPPSQDIAVSQLFYTYGY